MQNACPPRAAQAHPAPHFVELFRRARKLMRLFDVEGYERAVSCFQQVLELAPDYAPAFTGLAETYAYWGFRRELAGQEHQSCYDLAYSFAAEALRLAPERADSHRGMALSLRRGAKRDLERAKREALIAVDLDPSDAESQHQLWRAFGSELSDPSIQRARELDPSLCAAENDFGVVLCESGRLDEAVARFMAALRVNPRNSLVLYNLAMALDRKGLRETAVSVLRKARGLHPGEPLLERGWILLDERASACLGGA